MRSVLPELEVFERMQALRESRRDRAYRRLEDYKESVAKRPREISDRIIEGKVVAQLEHRSAQRSA